jgi:hypothetical protein
MDYVPYLQVETGQSECNYAQPLASGGRTLSLLEW